MHNEILFKEKQQFNQWWLWPIMALFRLYLETEIRENGVYVRFNPFHRKFLFFPWEQISKSFIREYRPIVEFGGWGLRGLGQKRALNVSGNIGLQLELTNGDMLLIGTQKGTEIAEVLNKLGKNTK